jgi:hypothetical protein
VASAPAKNQAYTHLSGDLTYPRISLAKNFNVSVYKKPRASLLFFNQTAPWFAGTLGDNQTERGWDGWGFFYRIVNDTDRKETWWTLMFSIWYPIIIFAILPLVFIIKRFATKNT